MGDAGFTQAPQVPGAGVVGIGAAGGLRKPLPTACGGQGQGLDIAVGVQVAVLPCQGRDQLAVEFPGLFPTAGHIGELRVVVPQAVDGRGAERFRHQPAIDPLLNVQGQADVGVGLAVLGAVLFATGPLFGLGPGKSQ